MPERLPLQTQLHILRHQLQTQRNNALSALSQHAFFLYAQTSASLQLNHRRNSQRSSHKHLPKQAQLTIDIKNHIKAVHADKSHFRKHIVESIENEAYY